MVIDKILCELEQQGYLDTNFKEYKKLVHHGNYVCKGCGRVGHRERNLCDPKRLYPQEKTKK